MPKRAAVVIGTNYSNPLTKVTKLQYAQLDAIEVAQVLEKDGYNVSALIGAAATRRAILESIAVQRRAVGSNGLLLIYFSGHGAVDVNENAYLLPADVMFPHLEQTAILLNEFATTYLKDLGFALALLDCCYSGHAVGLKTYDEQQDRGEPFVKHTINSFNSVEGRVVLGACRGSKAAYELADLRHGAFTYHFLEYWRNNLEVHVGPLFTSISQALESRNLPLPVQGGHQVGSESLRLASAKLRSDASFSAPQLTLQQRKEKALTVISKFGMRDWPRLLYILGEEDHKLRGTNREAKARTLINRMASGSWIGRLEKAIDEVIEAARQREVKRREAEQQTEQIINWNGQLLEAEESSDWAQIIELGELILNLEPLHQPALPKTANAYKMRFLSSSSGDNHEEVNAD